MHLVVACVLCDEVVYNRRHSRLLARLMLMMMRDKGVLASLC
jgi:hypothetical protein